MNRRIWFGMIAAVFAAVVTAKALIPIDGVSAEGRMFRAAAIGGETTGWTMKLKYPLQTASNTVTVIDVDPGSASMRGMAGRLVIVQGRIEYRTGVERGTYPVLVATLIQPVRPPAPIPLSRDGGPED